MTEEMMSTKQAINEIDKVHANRNVSLETVLADLREIQEHVEILIEAIQSDIRRK